MAPWLALGGLAGVFGVAGSATARAQKRREQEAEWLSEPSMGGHYSLLVPVVIVLIVVLCVVAALYALLRR